MTDSADDLDALFEEMASQRQETDAPPPRLPLLLLMQSPIHQFLLASRFQN